MYAVSVHASLGIVDISRQKVKNAIIDGSPPRLQQKRNGRMETDPSEGASFLFSFGSERRTDLTTNSRPGP